MASAPKIPTLVPTVVRRPPRLCLKGRQFVQYHVANLQTGNGPQPDIARFLVRLLLISRQFLHAFFDAQHFGPAKIIATRDGRVCVRKFVQHIRFVATVEAVVALLRLVRELRTIEIQWLMEGTEMDVSFANDWMRIVSQLHGKHRHL